ncbi:hypothetical protein HDU76_012305, partial [Blyttiomyces sp. JEL0837]
MCEIVVEECERAEFTKLMLEMKAHTLSRPIGKALFRQSKVIRNADYFTNEKAKLETATNKHDSDKIVQIQDMVHTDLTGIEKLFRDLREADYVVTTLNQMKKDLSYQGAQAEFARVETYLDAKWKIWFLRVRLAIASVAYTVQVRVMPESYRHLYFQDEIMTQTMVVAKKQAYDPTLDWNLAKVKIVGIKPKYTKLASLYCFSKLEPEAKRCADVKIVELDDCMEQYLQ